MSEPGIATNDCSEGVSGPNGVTEVSGPTIVRQNQAISRRWRYHFWIIAAAALVLTIALLMELNSDGTASLPFVGELSRVCAWQNLFAMDCPGCGLTRSFAALAHGQWVTAWRFNPAGWLFFAVCLYQLPYRGRQLWKISHGQGDHRFSAAATCLMIWLLIGALFAQWLWRMST